MHTIQAPYHDLLSSNVLANVDAADTRGVRPLRRGASVVQETADQREQGAYVQRGIGSTAYACHGVGRLGKIAAGCGDLA